MEDTDASGAITPSPSLLLTSNMPMSHAGEQLYLRFRIRRVRCDCGCHQCEKLSWLEPKARLTNAMIGWIQALLRLRLPIADVVRYCNVSWDTVKTYDKIQLQALLITIFCFSFQQNK